MSDQTGLGRLVAETREVSDNIAEGDARTGKCFDGLDPALGLRRRDRRRAQGRGGNEALAARQGFRQLLQQKTLVDEDSGEPIETRNAKCCCDRAKVWAAA